MYKLIYKFKVPLKMFFFFIFKNQHLKYTEAKSFLFIFLLFTDQTLEYLVCYERFLFTNGTQCIRSLQFNYRLNGSSEKVMLFIAILCGAVKKKALIQCFMHLV